MKTMTQDEFLAEAKARFGENVRDWKFVCPMCGTPQSIASLLRAGAPADKVEDYLGVLCEGRFTDAGPWPAEWRRSAEVKKRRLVRGCDWTLGGLFRIHRLEVITERGPQPCFELATPEQAAELQRSMEDGGADRPVFQWRGEGARPQGSLRAAGRRFWRRQTMQLHFQC